VTAYNIPVNTREFSTQSVGAVVRQQTLPCAMKGGGLERGAGLKGGRAGRKNSDWITTQKKEEFPGYMNHAAWELLSPDLRCF
jgi:hypothetical protein